MRIMYARLLISQYLSNPPESRQPKETKEIEEAFERVKEKLPDSTELLLLRVDKLIADQKPDKAEQLLSDELKRHPENAEIALSLALLLNREKKSTEAWAVVDTFEQKSGPSIGSLLTRLQLIPASSDARVAPILDAAEKLFKPDDPSDNNVKLAVGMAATQSRWGNPDKARIWLLRVVSLRPYDISVRFQLFDIANQAKDRAQMVEVVKEIHRVDGEGGAYGHYADAMLLLVKQKEELTSEEMAAIRQHLTTAALKRPTWANIPTALALLAELEGKPDEELNNYIKAVDLGEQRPEIIRKAVQLLCIYKRYPEAERLIKRIRTVESLATEMNKLMAWLSLINKETQKAVEQATAAVASDSKEYKDHLWQAEFFAAAGQNDLALKAFQRAIDEAGPHGAPWVALVSYYIRTAKRKEAEDVITEARKKLTGPELSLTLAQCQEVMGRVEEAGEAYRAAVEAKPDDLEALRQLIGYHERTRTLPKSIPQLRRALGGKFPPSVIPSIRQALAFALAFSGGQPGFLEALRLADENIAADPKSTDALFTKSRILATRLSSKREALQLMQQIARQRKLNPAEEFLLGQLYAETGAWVEGRRILVNLLGREGDNTVYLQFFIDQLLRNEERTEDAEVWLDRLDRVAPGDLTTTRLRAAFLIKRKQYTETAALIDKAAHPGKSVPTGQSSPDYERDRLRAVARLADQFCKDSASANPALSPLAEKLYREAAKGGTAADELALAGFLGRQGKIEEAVAIGRQAEAASGPMAVANTLISIAFSPTALSNAQLDVVEAELKACLGREKPSPGIESVKWMMPARRGRYREAVQSLRGAVERDGKNVGMLNNLAYMLILTNARQEEVELLLQKALALAGPTATILDTRGVLHMREGRMAEAVADLGQRWTSKRQRPGACTWQWPTSVSAGTRRRKHCWPVPNR